MSSQTVDYIKPPAVIPDCTLSTPIPWGGKAGSISFNKIKIPPGLTLHKINIHYTVTSDRYGEISGSPTHTTYVMPDAAFGANGIPVENIKAYDAKSNYISYIDSSYVNSFMQTYVESGNKITYNTNEDDSIITAKGSLYSSSSWESITTFYVKNAETVDTKNS